MLNYWHKGLWRIKKSIESYKRKVVFYYRIPLAFSEYYYSKEKNIFKITINEALKACSGRLTILAGIADDDTSVLLGKVTVFKTDIKLFINTKLMTHGQYAANSKGQISAILNNEDVSKFSIKEWEVEFKN